jgi:catechol 2,3-dioxygenase-like lactoylglutathione lyase family enzyme
MMLSHACKEERKVVNTQGSRPPLRWASVCIDCADADQMAAFYSRLLGWEIAARDTPATRQGGAGWVALRDPAGGIGLSFQAEEWYQPPVWPEEPGAQTKMLHFEIAVDDLDAAVVYVLAAGEPSRHTSPRTGRTTCG